MVQHKVVDKLNKFLPNPNSNLVNIVLRLLLNLSFDVEFCDQLSETPLLKKIVEMLKIGQMRSVGISILYQLSKSEKVRAALTFTECLPMVYQLLVKFPEPHIAPELASLAVNLTLYKKNCEVIVSKGFEPLITRAFQNGDMLLMKSMKNIVSKMRHKDVQQVINTLLESLIKAAFHRETPPALRLELLGIIA